MSCRTKLQRRATFLKPSPSQSDFSYSSHDPDTERMKAETRSSKTYFPDFEVEQRGQLSTFLVLLRRSQDTETPRQTRRRSSSLRQCNPNPTSNAAMRETHSATTWRQRERQLIGVESDRHERLTPSQYQNLARKLWSHP